METLSEGESGSYHSILARYEKPRMLIYNRRFLRCGSAGGNPSLKQSSR